MVIHNHPEKLRKQVSALTAAKRLLRAQAKAAAEAARASLAATAGTAGGPAGKPQG